MKNLIFILLVGCGNITRPEDPDASISVDVSSDASVDAPPDAAVCWMHRYPQCGNEIFDVCVPYKGCAFYTCNNETFGYCGPG